MCTHSKVSRTIGSCMPSAASAACNAVRLSTRSACRASRHLSRSPVHVLADECLSGRVALGSGNAGQDDPAAGARIPLGLAYRRLNSAFTSHIDGDVKRGCRLRHHPDRVRVMTVLRPCAGSAPAGGRDQAAVRALAATPYPAACSVMSEISVRLWPSVVPSFEIHTSTFDVLVRSWTSMRLCPG